MGKEELLAMFSLEGKSALIAGGSRGIGEEIARVYGLAGAKLVISSRRKEGIEAAAERIREKTGAEVLAVASHISNGDDRQKLVDEAMAWAGSIDILVNNAGTNPAFGPMEDVSESAWNKIFEVNLTGPFFLSQLVFKAWMKDNGGCIINTASVGAFRMGGGGEGSYCITKCAMVHLSKVLASEWAKHRVRVNALAPGLVKTRLAQALWDRPGIEDMAKDRAVPRLGEVEDMAGAALLLATGAGEFINGHALVLDNGLLVE